MTEENNFCSTTGNHRMKLTTHVKAGGCAAKISPSELAQIVQGLPKVVDANVLTSIESFEDAAVYKISEELALVQTIDFFPPVVDDPFLFGRIAAVNAISDVYAMGGRPVMALSVLCFPTCDFPLEVAQKIVAGGAAALKDAGAALVGGHSIQAPEPIYGLAVTGVIHPQHILTNGGAKSGDALVLTKRIGSGALLLANKAEILSERSQKELFDSLTQLNGRALETALKFKPHAATDVTGFGLVGHAHEMAKASNLKCRVFANQVPLLTDARQYASQGLVPAGAYANRKAYEKIAYINDSVELELSDLFFDPQTSGGLMFAVDRSSATGLASALQEAGLVGSIIGEFVEGPAGQVEVHSK